mgnify:CR=1 FL=1
MRKSPLRDMSANAPADLSAPPASGPIVPSLNGAIPNNLPPSSFIGCQLGNFRLVEMIGQGGFGTVYRAEHIYMQQSFAIKIIHNHQQHHNEILQRFQREARTMARLEHSNIVQLKDFGHLGEHGFYIVMEYLKGISLRDAIEREFPLSIARTKTIFQQICSALEYTHQKGIFHRDLKPSNILLLKEPGAATADTVKIIDFGIASVSEEDSQLTQTGMLLGSVPYISPEQVRGIKKFINGETDINDASRPIKGSEMEKAVAAGIKVIELPVAFDGLSVIVNLKNDWVDHLTIAELNKIWQPDSVVTTWKDVRPEWPDRPIRLYGPGTDSGTVAPGFLACRNKRGRNKCERYAGQACV